MGSGQWAVGNGRGNGDGRRAEIATYRDLDVWQLGMDVAAAAYEMTRSFPRDELFGMTGQIRRSAASVPANIAEGYGRDNRGDYVHHLRIAQGSLKELETHLLLAVRVRLLEQDKADPVLQQTDRVGRMLRSLYRKIQQT